MNSRGEPFRKNLDPNVLTTDQRILLQPSENGNTKLKKGQNKTSLLFFPRRNGLPRFLPVQAGDKTRPQFSKFENCKIERPYGTSKSFLRHFPVFSAHESCFFENYGFQLCDPMVFIRYDFQTNEKTPPSHSCHVHEPILIHI